MKNTIDGSTLVSKLLADADVKAEYDRVKPVMERAWELAETRRRENMSQAEMVRRKGAIQSA
jgi:nicotinamide mononucleotide adenylyltransferase